MFLLRAWETESPHCMRVGGAPDMTCWTILGFQYTRRRENFWHFFQYSEDFLWFLYTRVAIHEPLMMNPYFSLPSRIHISVYLRWIHNISVYPPRESDFNISSVNSGFSIPRCESKISIYLILGYTEIPVKVSKVYWKFWGILKCLSKILV